VFQRLGDRAGRLPLRRPPDGRTHDPGGDFPEGADEIVLYVHGWLGASAGAARDQGFTLETALRANDYDAPTAAVVWNSNQPVWPLAQQQADEAGRRLAGFLETTSSAVPGRRSGRWTTRWAHG
jgi:hypothetical protein